MAAPASRTAATSPATISTSQRARPGRDRRVQLEPAPQPQPHRGGEHGPPGWFGRRALARWRGLRLAGLGLPASGLPGSGDGWGGSPGRAAPATRAGGRAPAARAGRMAPGGRAHPPGRAAWAAPGRPLRESRDGTDGRDGSACRLGSSSGMGGGGPGGSGGRGRSGGSSPGPAGRTTWIASAAAPPSPLPGGCGAFSLVSSPSAAAHARHRRPLCPRAVKADRYAIACLCPPGHMEPDRSA